MRSKVNSDSKILKHDIRLELLQSLSADPANLGWAVNVIR
jgi:hypothetical protein